jgi:hypothetical protein
MSNDGNDDPPSWEDLVNQVQGALEELNLNSPENQALFVEGLKDVMESLEGMGFDLGFPPGPSMPDTRPDMQVIEGGKADEETAVPPTESKGKGGKSKASKKTKKKSRPDLKVAPPQEQDKESERGPGLPNIPPFPAFSGADPASLRTMFKVLRLGEDEQGLGGLSPLWAQGKIHLTKAGATFQNIFRGEEPRPYRIECTEGGLQIYLNGKPAEAIAKGQCTDVEASVIRVQAADEEEAKGFYTRLKD